MAADDLRVGVLLPTREMAMTGRYDMRPIVEFARRAEQLGFDSVWAGDSLTARPRLDPLVTLAAAATATTTVGVGTAALTAVLRHPLPGASAVASLDHAAGAGRLTVGVGSGFPIPETEDEMAAVGVPFRQRTGRTDETVRLWRASWRRGEDDKATFSGRYWQQDDLDRLPPPATPGGPPLWLAGSDTPRVVRRTAELYDGWLPFLPDPAAYRRAWTQITEQAHELGRPPGAVVPGLYATIGVDRDHETARVALDDYTGHYYARPLEVMETFQAYGYGTADQCVEWLDRYVEAGARQLVIRIGSLEPERHLDVVAEAVAAPLRARRMSRPQGSR